jgi:hypothetical protein
MSAKHTPGPWEILEHCWSDASIRSTDDYVVCSLNIRHVATEATQAMCEDRMDADARLIAAAPELLEALKIIASGGSEQFNWSMTKAEELARTAIAKAEGGPP